MAAVRSAPQILVIAGCPLECGASELRLADNAPFQSPEHLCAVGPDATACNLDSRTRKAVSKSGGPFLTDQPAVRGAISLMAHAFGGADESEQLRDGPALVRQRRGDCPDAARVGGVCFADAGNGRGGAGACQRGGISQRAKSGSVEKSTEEVSSGARVSQVLAPSGEDFAAQFPFAGSPARGGPADFSLAAFRR